MLTQRTKSERGHVMLFFMDLLTQDETAVQTDLSFLKAGIDFEKHSIYQ